MQVFLQSSPELLVGDAECVSSAAMYRACLGCELGDQIRLVVPLSKDAELTDGVKLP
jgi:hypothetical protein